MVFFSHPSEKYARQIGAFPQVSGWKIENIWNLKPPRKKLAVFPYVQNHLQVKIEPMEAY